VPLFFIIGIWGGAERRRAANKFFIYTVAGSVLTFAGVLYVAWFAYVAPSAPVELAPDQEASQAIVRTLGLGAALAILPVLMVLQAAFTLGLGYLLAAFNLFLRDIYHLIGVALSVGMFMTPIFYPAEMVMRADLGWVLMANPMYWLIDCYRQVLIYGSWPQPVVLVVFALVAGLVFLAGSAFFLAQKPRFPDML
jgi:hypothetical protein